MYRTVPLILAGLLLGNCASTPGNEGRNVQQVRSFVAAFNQQDVSAMLALTTDDVRWMSINGDAVSVETSGTGELRQSMQA